MGHRQDAIDVINIIMKKKHLMKKTDELLVTDHRFWGINKSLINFKARKNDHRFWGVNKLLINFRASINYNRFWGVKILLKSILVFKRIWISKTKPLTILPYIYFKFRPQKLRFFFIWKSKFFFTFHKLAYVPWIVFTIQIVLQDVIINTIPSKSTCELFKIIWWIDGLTDRHEEKQS